jgi:hypothetical protein
VILLCVNDHLQVLKGCGNAYAAWQFLAATFRGASEARVLQLRRQLTTLKKAPTESLTLYFARAETLAADLAAAGQTIGSGELTYAVLAGLPTQFDVAVTVLELTGQAMSLRELLRHLLPVEQQLQMEEAAEGTALVAPYQKAGSSKTAGAGKCFKCLQPGHRVADCPNSSSPQAKKCKKCGSGPNPPARVQVPVGGILAYSKSAQSRVRKARGRASLWWGRMQQHGLHGLRLLPRTWYVIWDEPSQVLPTREVLVGALMGAQWAELLHVVAALLEAWTQCNV